MTEHRQKRPLIREKKLKATNAYFGKVTQLVESFNSNELKQRIRTFSQNSVDEIIYTLEVLNGIENSVIIIHGPSGCASAQLNRYLSKSGVPWLVTNLNENDSILGADSKLKVAVNRALAHYKPEVIFIVSTPVVAINNDDIQSIIFELEEEVNVPLVPIYSDGFRSKINAYGYDLALHSFAKYLFPLAKKTQKEDYINLISVSESNKRLKKLKKILEDLGVKYNVIGKGSDINNIKKSINALATITVDVHEGYFLAEVLRDNYEVPYIKIQTPVGVDATSSWVLEIAKLLNKEDEAREYILKKQEKLTGLIEVNLINDKKVYINQDLAVTLQLAKLIRQLNGEVSGVTVNYIDNISLEELKDFEINTALQNIHVASGQIFELVNIVKKINPDIYIGKAEDTIWISKLGIKCIALDNDELYGYKGVESIVKQISKSLQNNNLENYLKSNFKLPYHENWIEKSANWHIKQEVK